MYRRGHQVRAASSSGQGMQASMQGSDEAHVLRMPAERPNLSASSLICTASSRVGASTSMLGPARGSVRVAMICRKPGSRKPQVLPLPVLAMATRSRPSSAIGHDCAWMGVGAL